MDWKRPGGWCMESEGKGGGEMAKVFAVEIRRGRKTLYRHSVSSVKLPTTNGPVTVLTGFRPAEFRLGVGVVLVTSFDGRTVGFAVDGGKATVTREGVLVTSPKVFAPEEIDEAEAQRDYDYASEVLVSPATPPGKLRAAKHAQQWALARLEARKSVRRTPAPKSRARPVRLSEHLSPEAVTLELRARDKWEAIEQLVDLLVAAGRAPAKHRAELLEAVVSREKMMSTALGGGLAIPHGSCKRVSGVAMALGVCREGIDFQALDGQPVHVVILALVKPARFRLYVRTLGGIARLFRDGRLVQELLEVAGPEEALERIRRAETERWNGN